MPPLPARPFFPLTIIMPDMAIRISSTTFRSTGSTFSNKLVLLAKLLEIEPLGKGSCGIDKPGGTPATFPLRVIGCVGQHGP